MHCGTKGDGRPPPSASAANQHPRRSGISRAHEHSVTWLLRNQKQTPPHMRFEKYLGNILEGVYFNYNLDALEKEKKDNSSLQRFSLHCHVNDLASICYFAFQLSGLKIDGNRLTRGAALSSHEARTQLSGYREPSWRGRRPITSLTPQVVSVCMLLHFGYSSDLWLFSDVPQKLP